MLESFQSQLANERVRWFSDNQNVARIVMYGSSKADLQAEALAIFSISVRQHIRIVPEWIPRELNELGDCYSRIRDCDDWMLNPTVFSMIDTMWGPHTIDRFADGHNHQLPRVMVALGQKP